MPSCAEDGSIYPIRPVTKVDSGRTTTALYEPAVYMQEGIRRQPGNNVLMDLVPGVRVGISMLPGS